MQINEVYSLAKWYMESVHPRNPSQVLTSHLNSIKTARQRGKTFNAHIEQCHSQLLQLVEELDFSLLTSNQRRCLRHMELESLLLEKAPEHYNTLFNLSEYDVNYVVATLEEYQQIFKAASATFNQSFVSLPNIIEEELLSPVSVPEGKVLTRLTFHNEASINNVVEFNQWAKSWNFIARGFAMSVGETPETFEIVNADRGSFIVDLLVGAGAMKVLFEALKSFTDLAISVTDLTMKLQQMKGLKNAVSDDLYEQFVKEAKDSIEKEENDIIEKVIEQLKSKGLIQNPEANNDLAKAIREMHKFNTQGGSIACLSSNDDSFDEESVKQLNESYRQLQHKSELKLIESHNHTAENSDNGWL